MRVPTGCRIDRPSQSPGTLPIRRGSGRDANPPGQPNYVRGRSPRGWQSPHTQQTHTAGLASTSGRLQVWHPLRPSKMVYSNHLHGNLENRPLSIQSKANSERAACGNCRLTGRRSKRTAPTSSVRRSRTHRALRRPGTPAIRRLCRYLLGHQADPCCRRVPGHPCAQPSHRHRFHTYSRHARQDPPFQPDLLTYASFRLSPKLTILANSTTTQRMTSVPQ